MIRYRVVRDFDGGYEAQVWRCWWPFWVQMWENGITNTFATLEDAKRFIHNRKAGIKKERKYKSVVWVDF